MMVKGIILELGE